jgi:hypothetical protein
MVSAYPVVPKVDAEGGRTQVVASNMAEVAYDDDFEFNASVVVDLSVIEGSQIIVMYLFVYQASSPMGYDFKDSQDNSWTVGEADPFSMACAHLGLAPYDVCEASYASATASSTGIDDITFTVPTGEGGCNNDSGEVTCILVVAGYDITGMPVTPDKQSSGNGLSGGDLSVTTFTPTSQALVLSIGLSSTNAGAFTPGLDYSLVGGQIQYPTGVICGIGYSLLCTGTSENSTGLVGATTAPEGAVNSGWAQYAIDFVGGIYTVTTVNTIKVVACNFYELECWWEPLIFYGMYVGLWVGIGATMSIRARSMTYLFGAAVSYASLYLILLGELPYPFALMAFIGAFAYGLRLDGVF